MQNRDRNRSDEDRSRTEKPHEEMRGNQGRSTSSERPSSPERSSHDRDSVLPRSEESESESGYSSRDRNRPITGEGEPADESEISGSRGFESESRREKGNGRTDRS